MRYKCSEKQCPDFDLCENCEANPLGGHEVGHRLLKIRVPRDGATVGRVCGFATSGFKVVHSPVVEIEKEQVVKQEVIEKVVEKAVEEEEKEVEIVQEEKKVDSIVTIAPILSESVVLLNSTTSTSTDLKKPLSATFISDVRPPLPPITIPLSMR